MANVSAGGVDALRASIGGKVSQPGDASYDEAVNIWNHAIARRPAVVASCASSGDVALASAFAEREGLEVSVRGGGHNFAGFALCDDGLLIDLTPMKAVSVDAAARRVRCGGGTTWAELDAATQAHGLAVPGGFVSHTDPRERLSSQRQHPAADGVAPAAASSGSVFGDSQRHRGRVMERSARAGERQRERAGARGCCAGDGQRRAA